MWYRASFTNTVKFWIKPKNIFYRPFFDWLIPGGGGERAVILCLEGGEIAICELKTQELIIGGKIVSTIFHHQYGRAWCSCFSRFVYFFIFKLLFYCFRSKNVSGKDSSQGSTRLPPIPKVAYPRFQQKQYQHFNMNYSHVQPFRYQKRERQSCSGMLYCEQSRLSLSRVWSFASLSRVSPSRRTKKKERLLVVYWHTILWY